MATRATRISAQISKRTRDLVEKQVRRTGVGKSYLVKQALLHDLQALDEVPAEYFIHPRVVVSRAAGEELLLHADPAEPTDALCRLMREGE